ncbi:Phage derived protein Gp49-like [Streptosporangium subroseum]|uniref:Phage derived protein Gp49-like n=1 Tax=Streptosporangium subroseum TaxID=106412 RepID=A0A239MUC6_9ACTN|nr:Phage derived protein Gp49-like [Streptosporangium subroseum]
MRLLFVFDPWRQAVFLVAGDKSGDWSGWYDVAIKAAEVRFARYLKEREQ